MEQSRVGLELRTLNNLIRRYFEFSSHRREIERVTGNNGWIIGFLASRAEQDVFQKDIEEHFMITRSTASKVLSLMERKGLIQRQAVAQDARLKKLMLTEKSRQLRAIMMEDARKMEATLMSGFTRDEEDTLLSYIGRMKQNIRIEKGDEKEIHAQKTFVKREGV